MANGGEERRLHSGEEVWARLNDLGVQQASFATRLDGLEETLKSGLNLVTQEIRHFRERESRPTNWLGTGSVVLTSMVVLAGFITLTNKPQDDDIRQLQEVTFDSIRNMVEQAEQRGRVNAQIESHDAGLDRLTDEVGRDRVRISVLEERIARMESLRE